MRTKFLRARYGFSRQFFDDGSAILKYVSTKFQAADILSKAKIDQDLESIRKWVLTGVLSSEVVEKN
jgi:glutaredoxin-related protein